MTSLPKDLHKFIGEIISDESILDLPIEKLRELAAMEGKTLEQWVEDTKASIETSVKIAEMDLKTRGQRPEGWSEEDVARFQMKVDSSEPGWLDEQKKLAEQNGKTLDEWLENLQKN